MGHSAGQFDGLVRIQYVPPVKELFMELKLLPEDIDKFIKEAVIKSALGKNIESTINKAVNDAINSYDSPIKRLVNEVIKELINDQLKKPEYHKLITDSIVNRITPKAIDDILSYGIEKLHEYVKDSNY